MYHHREKIKTNFRLECSLGKKNKLFRGFACKIRSIIYKMCEVKSFFIIVKNSLSCWKFSYAKMYFLHICTHMHMHVNSDYCAYISWKKDRSICLRRGSVSLILMTPPLQIPHIFCISIMPCSLYCKGCLLMLQKNLSNLSNLNSSSFCHGLQVQ